MAEKLLMDADIDPCGVDYLARLGGDWYAHATPDVMFAWERPDDQINSGSCELRDSVIY